MINVSLFLLGLCLGFGLAALLACGNIRRPNLPGKVSQDENDSTYHCHR